MKRILCAIITVLLSLLTAVSVSAAKAQDFGGVKFKLGSDYDLLTADNLTASSEVEGLVFAAISSDGAHQIQCRRTVTDFSTQIGSFRGLLHDDLAPVGAKLFPDGYTSTEFGADIYLKHSAVTDGQHSVVYVSVADGKLYTFSYFGSDPSRIGEFMSTVTLPDTQADGGSDVFMIVVLSVCIAVFVVLAVVLIFSFIKDYRRRKMEQSENIVSNYIKIKRRKY